MARGRQVCDAVAEQGRRMEGDARDQLQPQPRIIGEVGADLSTQRVFCAPDKLRDRRVWSFSCPFSDFYFQLAAWPVTG